MNLFQLVLKQMRQRALSTWLTLLSVLLGVGLAIAIMVLQREGGNLFSQSDYGFEVVVGAEKASRLQLVLNSVYHMESAPGNISYSIYERLTSGAGRDDPFAPMVKWAVPFAVGDNYKGFRVVATLATIFGRDAKGQPLPIDRIFQYRQGRTFQLAEGNYFNDDEFQAVLGSEVARRTGTKIGDRIQVAHDVVASAKPDVHDEKWTVVGILQPTRTANDRVVFIPLKSGLSIPEHEKGQADIEKTRRKLGTEEAPAPATQEADDEHDHAQHLLPKDQWLISGIWVKVRGQGVAQAAQNTIGLIWTINNALPGAMAVNPAQEMGTFFRDILGPSLKVLLMVSLLVTVVAAVSILVSIYNAISARRKEIAILRALGATRRRILSLICMEAALIGLLGGIIGLVVGHLLGWLGSTYLAQSMGQGIHWYRVGAIEILYVYAVTVLAAAAGLVPALKAYSTPVATNLMAA